jgi:hypothetical protein
MARIEPIADASFARDAGSEQTGHRDRRDDADDRNMGNEWQPGTARPFPNQAEKGQRVREINAAQRIGDRNCPNGLGRISLVR